MARRNEDHPIFSPSASKSRICVFSGMLEGSNRLPLPPFESETGGNSLPPTGQDENLTNIKNNPRPSTLLYEASETRAKPICFDLFSTSFKTASRGSSSFSLKRETPPDRRRTGEDSIKRPGEFIVHFGLNSFNFY